MATRVTVEWMTVGDVSAGVRWLIHRRFFGRVSMFWIDDSQRVTMIPCDISERVSEKPAPSVFKKNGIFESHLVISSHFPI